MALGNPNPGVPPRRLGVAGATPPLGTPGVAPVQAPAHPRFVDARPPVAVAMKSQFGGASPQAPSIAPVAGVPSIGMPAEAPSRRQVGFFDQGGVKTPIYHDQLASPYPRPPNPNSAADAARQIQMNKDSRLMNNLIRKQSSLYDYNHLDPDSFSSAIQALSGQQQTNAVGQANLQGVNAQVAAQYGTDPHRDPAYRQAMISNMLAQGAKENAQAAHFTAEADQASHPERQLDLLKQINADPSLRGMYLAGKGADPATIASLPSPIQNSQPGEPAINAANFGQHLAMPQNASMRALLESPEMTLLDRTRKASQFPGFGDMQNPNRQLFDQWLKSQYADSNQWLKDTYVPENPDNSIPFLGRIPGLVSAIYGAMPWSEGQGTGTGLNWRQNYNDASELQGLIQKHRISPY